MFSSYAKESIFADCMYSTYVAKRRAQFAPGVGQQTIMAAITPGNGAGMINDRYVAFLKSAYEEASKEVSGIYERDKKLGMKLPKWISFKRARICAMATFF